MKPLRHPIVFIFGAGATRGALEENADPMPPLDKDFFDIVGQVESEYFRDYALKVLKAVRKLYGKVHGVGLEYYFRDIDTRRELQLFAKPDNKPYEWGEDENELIEVIRRVYIHTTRDVDKRPFRSNVHKEILKLLKSGDTLVTFNYDMLIEESFPKTSLWKPNDGYGIEIRGTRFKWCQKWLKKHYEGARHDCSSVKLLKMHGSINWEFYKDNNLVRLKHYPYKLKAEYPRQSTAILPPQWKKDVNKKPYDEIWGQAATALTHCRTLVILGYSLPETDLMAHALLSEIVRRRMSVKARNKNYLSQLHIADPDESVRDRFIKMFLPALNERSSVMQYSGGIQEFATEHTDFEIKDGLIEAQQKNKTV